MGDRGKQQAEAKYERLGTDLGFAVQLSLEVGRGNIVLGAMYMSLMPAVRHKQILFAYNSAGKPVGFATWAYVSDDMLLELQRGLPSLKRDCEWNEGLNLWIVDVVAVQGFARAIVSQLRRELGTRFRSVYGLKPKNRRPEKRMVVLRVRN